MHSLMLICIVAGACCVQGFLLKRKLDRGNECFAHMAGEITEFYFDNEEAGEMVKGAMRECLEQKDNKEKCFLDKRKEFVEVYGENAAKGIDAILGGLVHVGTAVLQHCGGLEKYALKICAGHVLQGFKDHYACDEKCDVFIDLFGEKGAECEELDMIEGSKEGKEGNKESGKGSKESQEGSQESDEGSQESEAERETKRILGELQRLRSVRIGKYKK